MLYNKRLRKIWKTSDCVMCPYLDKRKKKCLGIGVNCFEFDEKTRTALDPVTKLPIKID